jgi:hypothetical protein
MLEIKVSLTGEEAALLRNAISDLGCEFDAVNLQTKITNALLDAALDAALDLSLLKKTVN